MLAQSLIGGAISAVAGLVVDGFSARGLIRLPAAVAAIGRPPALLRASGPVTVTQADWENDVWTVAIADGPAFSVAGDVPRCFRTPSMYTVYFVRRGRDAVLLAAEPPPGLLSAEPLTS